MDHPALLLLIALTLCALTALLFRPGRGLVPQWIRLVRLGRRAQIEDALKHLHDYEYRGRRADLQSLSGALEIPGNHAADLAARLDARGLVATVGQDLVLTEEGRRYALRVIRTHRLWEHYLAAHTSVAEADWHREADLREHSLSEDQVANLAARLGNPRFDPHGDPIPTAAGEIPPPRGQPLTALATGVTAEVVHVEDEPESVYGRLLALGLHPGTLVRVTRIAADRMLLEVDGIEQALPAVAAANVWVAPAANAAPAQSITAPERLHVLASGESASVVGLARTCRGLQRRRLLDLGVRPGAVIRAELIAPGGDPVGYRICGAVIALRRAQAHQILIERVADPAPQPATPQPVAADGAGRP